MRSTNPSRVLAALTATAAAAAALIVPLASGTASASVPTARLLGVHLDDSSPLPSARTAWKESVVSAELAAGRRMDLISTAPYGFGATFPSWREPWIVQNGSEPVINWTTSYTPGIVRGAKDSVLATRADALKAMGSPVMVEFTPGMDDPALASTVLTPANFKAAWVHVHNIFAAHGASNVSWVWCPSASSVGQRHRDAVVPR